MCQVDQEDQSEKEEECGSNEGNIVAPDEEETFRNEERQDDESQPGDDLRTPETILYGGTRILRGVDAE